MQLTYNSGVIKRVAKFIGTEEYSDDQIAKLIEHTSVDKMRANPMVNGTGSIDVIKFFRYLMPINLINEAN